MKIGIDIDGTLTDEGKWERDFASKYFFENFNIGIANNNAYETYDIFNIDKTKDSQFWNEHFLDYVTNCPARRFANEITRKLKNDGNEIYIITARGTEDILVNGKHLCADETKNIVENWLKKESICYDHLIFTPKDKLKSCQNFGIDVMIEDNPTNIKNLSKSFPVIRYTCEYNLDIFGDNIIPAYSWYDVYFKLLKFDNYGK